MPSVRFLYGWHGEDGLEGSVARIRCAVVLGRGGIEASGIPSFVGIGPHSIRHSPLRCRGGPCATTEKTQEGPCEALLFFVHRHLLCKQACNGLPVYKKSPQAMLESFFSVVVR